MCGRAEADPSEGHWQAAMHDAQGKAEGAELLQPRGEKAWGGFSLPTSGTSWGKTEPGSSQGRERIRGNEDKLQKGKFWLQVRTNILPHKSGHALEEVPREAAVSPTSEILKAQLDTALSGLIKL